MIAMDLQAIAHQTGDAWQTSATTAAARMRGPDGFLTVKLSAADAAIVQVIRRQQQRCPCCLPACRAGVQVAPQGVIAPTKHALVH